jgi:hypothetical protein
MVVRCTQKLAKKLKLYPLPKTDAPDTGSVWYSNLFRVFGTQYIIMAESQTLLTVLFPGKGITDLKTFAEAARPQIVRLFEQMNETAALGTKIAYDNEPPTMLAAQDRSLLACLRSITGEAKWLMEEGRHNQSEILSELMSEFPVQYGAEMDTADGRAFRVIHGEDIERRREPEN